MIPPPIKISNYCPDGDVKGDDGLPFLLYLLVSKLPNTMKNFLLSMFDDNNSINEKAVIGFVSFLMMCLFALADIITGAMGKDLVINDFIYDSFKWLTIASFGIASVDKFINKKDTGETTES
jgi:hypothetical protein